MSLNPIKPELLNNFQKFYFFFFNWNVYETWQIKKKK